MFTSREQTITVPRTKLLEILKTNRDAHNAAYQAALKEYWEAVTIETAALAARTAAGDFEDISVESKRPHHSLDHYDEAIGMLELSVDETVTMDKSSYRQYVQDNWGWKEALAIVGMSNKTVLSKYAG